MATKISEINIGKIKPSKLPLVIGYFGSVHVMHSQLLDKYHRYNILTFKDFAKKAKSQLYTYQERIDNLVQFKPKNIFVFDIKKNNMKAEDFIQKVLLPLQPSAIVVGTDFKFGSDHKPHPILNQYFTVDTIRYNKGISSSKISDLLMNKGVEKANGLLFTPYYYISKWIKGNKQGRKLGYRTINLAVDHKLSLCEGSYVTKVKLGSKTHKSVSFVGKSKTFKTKTPTLEVHIIKKHIPPKNLFVKSIRNKVKVQFLKFIRPNTLYKTHNQLIKAIEKDIAVANKYFEQNK